MNIYMNVIIQVNGNEWVYMYTDMNESWTNPAQIWYTNNWADIRFSQGVNLLVFEGKKWNVFLFWTIIRFSEILRWSQGDLTDIFLKSKLNLWESNYGPE